MFWTAFIWGLGVTVGGSIGLMLFVVLFFCWSCVAHSKTAKRANELAELSQAALVRRNELTEKQIDHLAVIADAADVYQRNNRG